ncbi:MAG: S1 RNA-binding domain-containing protein, partial [Anaerolineales bacterium]|nr:S1 RNA-binding domain-containing protein [Anaerolineales bacterium]
NEVLVDIGAKSEGIINSREVENMDDDTRERLAVGKQISVYVVSSEDQHGNIVLSYEQAAAEAGWTYAKDLLDSQETYDSQILGYNKGGLLTKIENVRAFIPASQLGGPPSSGTSTDDYLSQFVGQTLETKVIEVDRSRNRLILSARAAAKRLREKQKKKLLITLNEGDVVQGKVVNLERFGAFVDIGGLQGLVHLSEISWKRISHPADEVSIGETLDVYVLSIDHDKQRVALSMKRLSQDPWNTIEDVYQTGQLVEVTITKLERYGAFARLNDNVGLEGLIHVSELSEDRIQKPSDIIQKGDVVTSRIIRIDPEQRQLGLSIKQVSSGKFLELDLAQADNNETLTANDDNEE